MREHDRVILNESIGDEHLEAGDIGTVVHIYANREALEVEFVALDGRTVAVVQVSSRSVRPIGRNEIAHARSLVVPG
jgi:hypothetical protein